MNAKYSLSQYTVATLAAAIMLVTPTACNDDLGYSNIEGQRIAFKLTASDTWHKGISVNENAPTTHCTSVRALSGGDTKLYLHTVVADNPAEEKVAVTRGTPVKGTNAFKTTYPQFSLSGIYTEESQNAYDLHYESATGTPMNSGKQLLCPSNGSVNVFAFAPTIADFNTLVETDGSLILNKATQTSSPTLTYTVPTDVTKQVDLMTAHTTVSSASPQPVELEFGHALTAVQIKCGRNMLAGKITEVTIDGIYGKGKQVIGTDIWTTLDDYKAKYTISKEITLSPGEGEGVTDKIHVPENTPIAGTPINSNDVPDDNLTFMLLPQTLPEGAAMTIKFIDDATQTKRILTASIAGHKWEAGKIVTYSVSPSSIHISAKVEFNKKGITADKTGDTIPYSGVWYDATYTAKAEVVQGDDRKTIENIEVSKIQYSFDGTGWEDCTKDANGLLTIKAQSAYTKMSSGFKTGENGSEESPHSLPSDYNNETANCYLVDQAGYYSLPLVYGNGRVAPTSTTTSCFRYYPKHDNDAIPTDGKIANVKDAVLCWQDAPDLIDSASVKVVKAVDGDKLVFRIRQQTLAQGNALLAVRNEKKEILWSWHIWVTPHKDSFYRDLFNTTTYMNMSTKTDELRQYQMARYHLGWCDSHEHNDSRTFHLQAVIDMSAYGGGTEETVDIGTFTQMEFKGSDAGDNTYYQWGRKDPMLGGIYNNNTPTYKYMKKGTTLDTVEFTMENKQVFNQYNQDGCNYSFCKNPGDKIDIEDYASNGVTIGYSIQHPYMFVTNSRCADDDAGDDLEKVKFNYRNHWHKWKGDITVPYLQGDQILLNAWNADATMQTTGLEKPLALTVTSTMKDAYLKSNAANIEKSVYDPCPPGFKVPPIDAFREIYHALGTPGNISFSNNVWTVTCGEKNITFPSTGVRNYALRTNEWNTVVLNTGKDLGFNYTEFYKISMPAFRMLTFISSATIIDKGETEEKNRYQLLYFGISNKGTSNAGQHGISSNSYGLTVRPIRIQIQNN